LLPWHARWGPSGAGVTDRPPSPRSRLLNVAEGERGPVRDPAVGRAVRRAVDRGTVAGRGAGYADRPRSGRLRVSRAAQGGRTARLRAAAHHAGRPDVGARRRGGVHSSPACRRATQQRSRYRRDSGVRDSRRRDFVSGRPVGAFGRETWRDRVAERRRPCHMAVACRCGRLAVVDPCCGSGGRLGRSVDRCPVAHGFSTATPEGREQCRTHQGIGWSWCAMSTVV
jgi:hypothetical protein